MTPILPEIFLHNLSEKLSPEKIFTDTADCWLYSYDNGRHRGLPSAVVFPQTTADVQHIIKTCFAHRIPLTPRGRGTGTPGGAVALQNGIILSFEKMDKILEINPQNRLIKTQTGVLNQAIQATAKKAGFFWVPDPGSSGYCTVGGNIGYNSGGPNAVKYGTTREHVLALTAVTGTGEIIHTGSYTTKGAVGYDLTRLLIGSEGTLAVITEAALKLTPLPSFKNTFRVIYKDIASAVLAVTAILSQAYLPCALEFLDQTCLKFINIHPTNNYPEACLLLINIDDAAAVSPILNALQNPGLIDLHLAKTSTEIHQLWSSRKQLSQKLRTLAPKKISEDVVVPVSAVAALLEKIDGLSEKTAVPIVTFGHIGNGNLHVNLLINNININTNIILEELFHIVIDLNGTLSGEHGIGIEKRPYITRAIDESTLQIMKNIKNIFDPENILNPGKIF